MSSPITSCDTCGQGITDADLEAGNAVRILGKSYCARCKSRAIDSVSLEDLGRPTPKKPIPVRPSAGGSPRAVAPPKPASTTPPAAKAPSPRPAAPAPKAPGGPPEPPPPRRGVDVVEIDIPDELPAPAGKDAPAVPVPAKAEAGRSPAPRRRPAAKTARRSRAPVFLGLGLALVGAGAGVGLILVSARNKGPKPPAPPAVENGTGATPPAPADPREERAREAFAKAQTAASRSESSFEEILAAVDQARDACRGTAFEAKLESLRNKVLREKEMIAAQKEYGALLDELKAAVAGDPEFKRYGDLRQKFQQARDLASRVGASALSDVQRLQQDYSGRYEKAAQPFFDEIREAVTALADVERRFDHALQKIETFPAHLRHSGAWRELERLKADIERRKKASSK